MSRGVTANATGGAPLDPRLFHTLNLLVHLLNVLVVWRILRLLLDRTRPEAQHTALNPSLIRVEWAAGGGALLFAMHPLQVEAIAWATGLKDVLCGFLSFVAVWQYLSFVSRSVDATASRKSARGKAPRSLGRYWLATGAFMLALLAKPTAVVVPVLAWILDVWGWPQPWRNSKQALLAWLDRVVLQGVLARLPLMRYVFEKLLLLVRPGLLAWLGLAALWGLLRSGSASGCWLFYAATLGPPTDCG